MPDLGKQVGPLPLGAWIAVVGGSLAFMAYSRSRGSSDAAPVEVAAGPDYGVGIGGMGAVGAYTATDGGVNTPAAATATIETNVSWGRAVFNWLAGTGVDGSTVDRAVRNYLDGRPLSTQENALISQALSKFGQAPEGLSAAPELSGAPQYAAGFYGQAGGTGIYYLDENNNLDWLTAPEYASLGQPGYTPMARDNPFWTTVNRIGEWHTNTGYEPWDSTPAVPTPAVPVVSPTPMPAPAPAPPPVPAPAPAAGRTYTVQPGDSLSRIASRYWEPWITWQSLYNANKGVIGGNPNLIRPGQVLVIA